MPQQNQIIRENHGSPHRKIPFIIAMIDSNGNIQTLPFPPQEGIRPEDRIYGIELMINPQSMSSNLSKIVNRTQTMTAFVEDHWGEELDTITFQGYTATFVTGGTDIYSIRNSPSNSSPVKKFLQTGGLSDPNIQFRSELASYAGVPGYGGEGMGVRDREIGLTTSQRRKSVSYRLFKRFVDLIRINGCTFDTFGLVSKRYYLMLSYGNSAYRGYFESIDVTEMATSPFRFQYTVTFKSEQTIYSYTNQGQTATTVVDASKFAAQNLVGR
jgi:hypothetical protein